MAIFYEVPDEPFDSDDKMNQERIIKFCEKEIIREQLTKKGSSVAKIEAYKNVIAYINEGDTAKETEVGEIKKIFEVHYNTYIQKVKGVSKPIKYTWNKKHDAGIKKSLIPAIKQEMGNNEEHYGEMTTSQFFEAFMQNMPIWWKQNQFSMDGITRHFDKIYNQIMSTSKNGMNGHSHKTSVSDVLEGLTLNGEDIA